MGRVAGRRVGHQRRTAQVALSALCAFGLTCAGTAPAVAADGEPDPGVPLNSGQCNFPSDPVKGMPWSLQRLLFDEMWSQTRGDHLKVDGKGRPVVDKDGDPVPDKQRGPVRVAVIDTGVDNQNKQLVNAVAKGKDLIEKAGDGTDDGAGHGTKVAGIIAARADADGDAAFIGIAPRATIIPIRQNDNEQSGNVKTMVQAIEYAISAKATIINISQGTTASLKPGSPLEIAINKALAQDILVVASAGNNGADGKVKPTFPASFEGVLGVAASDRNNERAGFSQPGPFVDLAAPGVDMLSTVPVGGHCLDEGTSFAAPYVAGVAALVRAKHPDWTYEEVTWHLQQTAERVKPDRDDNIGWGVVDPVSAMTNDEKPEGEPEPDVQEQVASSDDIQAAKLILGETPQERRARYGIYVFGIGLFVVAVIVGAGTAVRDWRRKKSLTTHGEAQHG